MLDGVGILLVGSLSGGAGRAFTSLLSDCVASVVEHEQIRSVMNYAAR